ncbi:MAG: ABC transporter substrate-binding protein [Candidatus Moraniibacteriota bacterium]
MKKNTWLIVVGIVVVLGIVGFVFNSKRSSGTTKIVALYPLTGGLASWGESSQKSTQLAVDEINAKGGVNGKKLEIVYQDHKCDPKEALSIYQQSLTQSKIFTSSSCSGTVLAIAPNLKNDSSVLLATVVASTKISSSSPFVYRNWVIETKQAEIAGQEIKSLGLKKIGIINEETDFGKGLATGLRNYLKDSGVTVVADSFATGATDIRTQLTKLKAANVEALFIAPQTEASSEVILTQMEELNFKPKLLVNDIILGAPNLIAKHQALLEGARGGNFVSKSDKLQGFLDKYKAKYGSDCAHTTACAVAYDTAYMIADAIKANGDSPQGVADYMRSVNYQGVSGTTTFDQANDRSGVGYVLSEIKGGQVQLVK